MSDFTVMTEAEKQRFGELVQENMILRRHANECHEAIDKVLRYLANHKEPPEVVLNELKRLWGAQPQKQFSKDDNPAQN